MKKLLFFNAFLLTFMFILAGCMNKQNNPNTENIQQNVPESQKIQSGTFYIDQEKSNIEWIGTKTTGSHNGNIKVQKGIITTDKNGKIQSGKFMLDMNSIICTDLEGKKKASIEGHLKDPDFFDVEAHPTAMFIIKEANEESMKGELIIKGIAQKISFNYKEVGDLSYEAVIKVDRTIFDIKYKSKSIFPDIGDHFIHDEFTITLNPLTFKSNG
jgi:polyisoprenoid-binding protein YceI